MKPYSQRFKEVLAEVGSPAESARQAFKNVLYVLNAELVALEDSVWDRRNTDERYHEYRTRHAQIAEITQMVKALLAQHDGIRMATPPLPQHRDGGKGYGEL